VAAVQALKAGSGRWTAADIGDLSGRTALITGASAGIGLEIARVLAARGALIVMACRDVGQAERAAGQVRAANRAARLEVVGLDLARQASVRAAAAEITARYRRLDLLFAYELDRRLRAAGAPVSSLGAHPGVVYTSLFRTRSRLNQALLSPWLRVLNFGFVQNVRMGALPALRAAADPRARGGEFYGPRRRHDTGYPVVVRSSERSHDAADQARLWEVSEELTGVRFMPAGVGT
jgi:NAD(P)-dependent dehydrogenase (short-subunit alcohol dehydrogenase family)